MLKILSIFSDTSMKTRIQNFELKIVLSNNIENIENLKEHIYREEYDLAILDKDVWFFDEAVELLKKNKIEYIVFNDLVSTYERLKLKEAIYIQEQERLEKEKLVNAEVLNSEPVVKLEKTDNTLVLKKGDNRYLSIPSQSIILGSLSPNSGSTTIAISLAKYMADILKLKTVVIEPPFISPYLYDYLNVFSYLKRNDVEFNDFYRGDISTDSIISLEGVDYIVLNPKEEYDREFSYQDFLNITDLFKKYPIIIFDFSNFITSTDDQILNMIKRADKTICVIDSMINKIISNVNKINYYINNDFDILYLLNKDNQGINRNKFNALLNKISDDAVYMPFIEYRYLCEASYKFCNPFSIEQVKEIIEPTLGKICSYLLPENLLSNEYEPSKKNSVKDLFNKLIGREIL